MDDWINSFVDALDFTPIPEIFRRWAGILTISGALEQKVWITTKQYGTTYPHLYVLLVGPPGSAKSLALKYVRRFWSGLEHHKIGAENVSKASLLDELKEAERNIVQVSEEDPVRATFNTLLLCVSEFGVFLPEYDRPMMATLTDIYDCTPVKDKKRTSKINLEVPRPQFVLAGGCTAAYLADALPESAWDQGFLSRVIIIHCTEEHRKPLTQGADTSLEELEERLVEVSGIYGECSFTPEALEFLNRWHVQEQDFDKPKHPRLRFYCSRRTQHLMKLSTIASFSESLSKRITLDNVHRALDWLIEAESHMPEIFDELRSGGDMAVIRDAASWVISVCAKTGKPVGEAELRMYLSSRVLAYRHEAIMDIMEAGKLVKAEKMQNVPGKVYRPGERVLT